MDLKQVLQQSAKPQVEKKPPEKTQLSIPVSHAEKAEFNRLVQALKLDRNKTLAGAFRTLLEEMQQAEQRGKK
jgi:hypothetical protein